MASFPTWLTLPASARLEDGVAGDAVYHRLLDHFVALFERRAARPPAPLIRLPVAGQAKLLPFRPSISG